MYFWWIWIKESYLYILLYWLYLFECCAQSMNFDKYDMMVIMLWDYWKCHDYVCCERVIGFKELKLE